MVLQNEKECLVQAEPTHLRPGTWLKVFLAWGLAATVVILVLSLPAYFFFSSVDAASPRGPLKQLGSLNRVSHVVRLGVYVAATPEFTDHAGAADAASELLRDVLGESTVSSRLVIGVNRRAPGFTGSFICCHSRAVRFAG